MEKSTSWNELATASGKRDGFDGKSDDQLETFGIEMVRAVGGDRFGVLGDRFMTAKALEPVM
jgi:hypothetical protein